MLRFLTDFSLPSENNQAGRDLRMDKLRQKTSGCFRSEGGARCSCGIRFYTSAVIKRGGGVLMALEGFNPRGAAKSFADVPGN